jgi:hypothetical protein
VRFISTSRRHARLALLLVTQLGCSSSPPLREESRPTSTEKSAPVRPLDTLAVAGIRGTLSQEEIKRALEPKLPKFLRCAELRLGELEVLSGRITFGFHLAANGSVTSVQANKSTLGDRATERCMVEVAQATRFPEPHGGEADFTWPLELPLDPDVRAPVELPTDLAQPVSSTRRQGASPGELLQSACGGGAYVVTAYIDPSGHVLAAGAATPDPATGPELDCITSGVRDWSFPSPGSYLGKLSFTVP